MWKVQVLGDPNSNRWEISAVKDDTEKDLFKTWGWFDKNKLLVSHSGGPCSWPLADGLGDKMLEIAEELVKKLNSELNED